MDGRADEVVLTRAQQAILTPRTRTEAELSWLPGLSPSQAKEILSKLEGSHLAHADQALDGLRGLDRADLAADLCARSAGETKYVGELLEAYGEFSAGDVLETLTGLRSVSGFPIPDQPHVQNALAALKVTHAKAAVACISAAGSPGQALTEIVEVFLDWGDEEVDHLLGLIVREYDACSEPFLNAIKEKIEAGIAAHRDGDGPIPVNQLVGLLAEWDEISQPVQLLEESKGHEEPRSEIYETVRDFCLWLANEKGRYEQALAISRALLETFPELPAVAAQLSQDVDALESLAAQAKSIKLMAPLIRAQEAAQEEISVFDADLVLSGFGPNSRGLAKKLYDAFAEVAAKTMGTELADMPWMVVRGLAIDLNNEHESSEGACALLEGLLNYKNTAPSQAVVDKLTVDKRTLRRNRKWEELKGTSADVAKGISLVTELLDEADADERATLLQLKTALERKRAAATRKRMFWGLAAAAFVGFLIYDANKKPSYSPRPSPSSPNSTSSSQTEEQAPPPGIDRVLNRSEV